MKYVCRLEGGKRSQGVFYALPGVINPKLANCTSSLLLNVFSWLLAA